MNYLEKKIQTNWLISFGDLLTLLLCFFIALIAFGGASRAKDTPQSTNENSALASVAKNDDIRSRRQESGTQLAKNEEGGVSKSAPARALRVESSFGEDELKSLSEAVNQRLRIELSPYFNDKSHELVSAEIESCRSKGIVSEAQGWLMSDERATTLRRQLIDLGVAESKVRIRSLGPFCEEMTGGDKGQNKVLMVRLEFA